MASRDDFFLFRFIYDDPTGYLSKFLRLQEKSPALIKVFFPALQDLFFDPFFSVLNGFAFKVSGEVFPEVAWIASFVHVNLTKKEVRFFQIILEPEVSVCF